MKKAKYVFFIVLCFLFLFTGCPSSPEMENKEPIEMNENEKKAVADYIEAFAYGDQGEFLKNLSNSLGGSSNGLTAECTSSPDAMEISLVFNSYDYDGDDGNRLVSGEVTLSLSGKYEEGTTLKASSSNTLPYFEATSYTVSSDALTLTGGEQTVVLKLEEVSGVFSNDAYEGEETPLVFEMSEGKISISQTSISSTVFRNADSGNIAAEGRNLLPVSSFMQIVNENVPAKEMNQEMISALKEISQSVLSALEESEDAKTFSSKNFSGTCSLEVYGENNWSITINVETKEESSFKYGNFNFYFNYYYATTSDENSLIEVTIDGRSYKTKASNVFAGIEIPSFGGLDSLQEEDITLLNSIVKEVFKNLNIYTEGEQKGVVTYEGLSIDYSYSFDDYYSSYDWGVKVSFNSEKLGGSVSFSASAYTLENNVDVNIDVDNIPRYTVPVERILAGANLPVFFSWNISVRVAKPTENGSYDDLENWEKISASIDNGKIVISAEVGSLSSDGTGNTPFAILIGTGADDITSVSKDGKAFTSEDIAKRDEFVSVDGLTPESDEFVLLLTAETADGSSFILSHDGVDDYPVSIEFKDTTPFEWDFSVRLAKENGAENGNLEYVKPIELTGDIYAQHISIEAYVDAMKKSSHEGVEGKWIALLIGTGANDISRLAFSDGSSFINFSEEDKAERDKMVASDGSSAEVDEFVIYLNLEESGQYMHLSKDNSHMTLQFNIKKLESVTIEEPNWTDVKSDLTDFIKAFASVYSSTDFEENVTYLNSAEVKALPSWTYEGSVYYDFGEPLMPVNSVKMLNDKEFSANTTFEIYIGGNRVYKDLGWYIDETTDSLMINKAALYITFLFNDYFEINGERLSYGTKSYPELDVDDIWWSTNYDSNGNANYNTRTKRNDGSYDIEVATTDIPLFYQHENREEGDIMFSFVTIEENGSTSNVIVMRRGSSSGFAVYPYGYVEMTSSEPEGILTAVEDRIIREDGIVLSSNAEVKGNFKPVMNVSSVYVQSDRYDIIKKYFISLDFVSLIKAINERTVTSGNGGTLSAEEGWYGWYEFNQATDLTVYLYADNWEYQNNDQSHTLTGDFSVKFTGYMDETGNTFSSTAWMIQSDQRSTNGSHDLSIDGSEHNLKTFSMWGNFSEPLAIGLITNSSGELDWNKEINMGTSCSFVSPSVSTFIDDKFLTRNMFQEMMK